jgi:ATP phosphoribosyltransferase regulatory subunit
MVYHPPSGARDLLPLDVAQKYWIEDRLEDLFQRWGYHRIITSTVESLDTLMAGGAIDRATVVQLQGASGQPLGLRPELTASIARAAVTRMAQVSYPQRLYYTANVFRQGGQGDQQEYYQAGVELLGTGGTLADAEVLMLLLACVSDLKLDGSHVIVGNAGLTRSLLDSFPPAVRPQVRDAIARLDRVQLETLELETDLHTLALTLMDLRGQPRDVLQAVSQLPLADHQRAIVADLKALFEILHTETALPPVILDLSLIQPFDYYTGLVFEVVADTPQGRQVVGQGGRYDNLLGVFHPQGRSYPGIGFMLSIESLHQALLPTGYLPEQIPASDWLVVPTQPHAATAAFT